MKSINLKNYILTAACSTLLSCSSTPKVQEFPVTASAVEEIQNLDYALANAKASQIDVLSPENYENADEALRDAKKRQANAKSPEKTLHFVAVGNAYLNQAKNFAKISNDNMKEVVLARQNALDAGAMLSQKESLEEADEALLDVTSSIEDNDLSDVARERTNLQAQYRDIELRAIKHRALTPATVTMKMANDEGGAEYAPRSQAKAKKQIEDADAFITSNRNASMEISDLRANAEDASDHYLKMTRAVKAGKTVSGEDAALALEDEQIRTAQTQKQLEATDAMLSETQNRLVNRDAESQAQAQRNAKDQALQARYEKARQMFNEDEAEVYKQGDKLLIRLRGLKFPSAQAVLKGADFALLSKVDSVLNEFGETSIVVQGYTDSDGSKSGNQKLSTARANAVRQYFVASSNVNEASIEAIGFGDRNPLAPNNTKLGKAQNRRVDIVITPKETIL